MVRRLLLLIPVLAGLSVIVFFLSHAIPVDPVRVFCNLKCPPATYNKYRRLLGLDQPVWIQYIRYMQQLLQGNLGFSTTVVAPLTDVLYYALPATLELTITAVLFTIVLGLLGGVVSGAFRDRIADHLTRLVAVAGVSIPVFFLGVLLRFVFAHQLHLLPFDGYVSHPPRPAVPRVTGALIPDAIFAGRWAVAVDATQHLILPALTLTFAPMAAILRMTRSGLLDQIGQPYLQTARAKGVPEHRVILRHALPNSLIPVVTVIGAQMATILGGSAIVETIFTWPGMGGFVAKAAVNGDSAGIVGITLIFGIILVTMNLIVDLLYGLLDPRISLT